MAEGSPTHFLQINRRTMQENKSVYFSKPRLVAFYDVDYSKITPAKQIKYFREPGLANYPMDLNDGYESFRFLKRCKETRLLHPLLHTMTSRDDFSAADVKDGCAVETTNVYTRRGYIKEIMGFCYGNRSNFRVLLSRHNGSIFMIKEEQDRNSELEVRKPIHTHHNRLFRLLFSDSPDGLPDTNEHGDENISQVCVHSSTLGQFQITYAGEVQGIISDEKIENVGDLNTLNEARFVLTKQLWIFLKDDESKLRDYWLQAYLANVDDMYFAYKDKGGVIRKPIEHIKTSDIPKKCSWKPGFCTRFLHEFLEKVDQLMSEVNSLDTVYEFNFNAKKQYITYSIHLENPEKSFIPKEYSEFIKNSSTHRDN